MPFTPLFRTRYHWSWDAPSRTLSCHSDPAGSCDAAVCACDRAAALSFAAADYNADNKRESALDAFAGARWGAFKIFGTWVP